MGTLLWDDHICVCVCVVTYLINPFIGGTMRLSAYLANRTQAVEAEVREMHEVLSHLHLSDRAFAVKVVEATCSS